VASSTDSTTGTRCPPHPGQLPELGFPKGHLESGERSEDAAVREVREETGIDDLALRGQIETIDWYFRFRGQLIHKVCHFYLMETSRRRRTRSTRRDHRVPLGLVRRRRLAISYANARKVLARAHEMIVGPGPAAAESRSLPPTRTRAAARTAARCSRRGDRS
jgi:ADP-ribose pyrophosphatase YjhB (NUDIX family)